MVPISPMQRQQQMQQQQQQLTSSSGRRAATASPFRQSALRNMNQSAGRMEEATGGTRVWEGGVCTFLLMLVFRNI